MAQERAKPELKFMDPRALVPSRRNPKDHGPEDVGALAGSYETFGPATTITVQSGTNRIVAGHGRALAAIEAGLAEVPVIVVHFTDAEADAFMVADNRFPDLAPIDEEREGALVFELEAKGFGPDTLGFTLNEGEGSGGPPPPPDGRSAPRELPTCALRDQFWILVRGPMQHQAKALERLRVLLGELAGVETELGSTPGGDFG